VWTKRSFAILSAGSALAVFVLLLALWPAYRADNRQPSVQSRPTEFTVTQLTSEPGTEKDPGLSPDGKWVVYRSGPPDKGDIYLQGVGGRTPINLTKDSPADDSQPTFSPDGERIVFRSEREGGGLFLMGRTGESVTRLTDTGYNPAWSPDGTEVVYGESPADDPYTRAGLSRLWIVKVANGDKHQLTETDGVQPSWSPHGLRIAYWAVGGSNRLRDIVTIPAAGGQPAAVTNDAAVDANPIWAPDGKHLYFISDRSGSMNLWRIAIDESSGKVLSAPEPVPTPSPFVLNLTVSSDGKRLAFTSILSTQNIQKIAFDPIAGRTIGAPVPVTTGTRRWQTFNPSPDGQWVAMDSGPPQEDIYVIHADGSGLRQLTNDAAFDRSPFWSPDGGRIAFHSNRGGVQQIWSVKPDGSELRRLSDYPGSGLLIGTWSPDASRIAAFVQTVDRIVLFDPRKAWQDQTPEELPALARNALLRPIEWSPDGLRLTCEANSGTFVYSFRSKSYQRLTEYPASVAWLQDNRRLLTESRDGRLLLIDSLSKHTSELLSILPQHSFLPHLSRDNRQIFFMRRDDQADIYMLSIK
jgi:Tol biopolymer transport system component